MLKFVTTLGIRNNGQPVIRWSNVSKPALGGISFYISFLLSTACFSIFFDKNEIFKDLNVIGMMATTALAFLMGLADDAYNTKPFLKFFIQLFCGIILIMTENYIQIFNYDFLNYAITILWVIGIMNSINMLDNMDGITSIVSIFILLTCLAYLTIHNNFNHFDFIAILGVLGALIGFVFYNWHPSKMFMGDTGSQFMGVFLATISIKYIWNSTNYDGTVDWEQQLTAVLITFILPIIDTTTVVINRIIRKQSPFIGGKDHTTHHLSYLGFSDSQIGFIFLGISALSLIISIAFFRFIDQWKTIYSLGFLTYFLLLFSILFYTTQSNKEKRS